MSIERDKASCLRIPLEAVNQRNLAVLDEVIAPDAVDRAPAPGFAPTREGTKEFLSALCAAFPDIQYKVEDAIAEGDRVVIRQTAHGTMKGNFAGMPASNKSATWSEIHVCRMANGKLVEHWQVVDQLGMLQQLGFIPLPGAPAQK
jgi:steroid delta-isomerase-like uncharacterized protein